MENKSDSGASISFELFTIGAFILAIAVLASLVYLAVHSFLNYGVLGLIGFVAAIGTIVMVLSFISFFIEGWWKHD